MLIQSLLIVNRSEIACRTIRTARRMGIRTVAVYSEVNAKGRHVWHAAVFEAPMAERPQFGVFRM